MSNTAYKIFGEGKPKDSETMYYEKRDAVVAMYGAGLLTKDIATKLKISHSTVSKIMRLEGIAQRPRGDEIKRAFEAKKARTKTALAKAYPA